MSNEFDLLVIGGGHAGLEAAYLASKYPIRVGLLTLKNVSLGSTPCNPSIGGTAKGHLVRELDALGGLMPQLADLAGIQYRTLNESKGQALYSTRVQVDKVLYSEQALKKIQESKIEIIYAKVEKVLLEKDLYEVSTGVGPLKARALVVTTGTFLKGLLHCGTRKEEGGRRDQEASSSLKELFPFLDFSLKRFKTGTPARILKESINFEGLVEQPSDSEVVNFHRFHEKRQRDQMSCFLTRTTEKTIEIIHKNKERSPMYNGQIEGIGPRYCPSIEDKVFRYPEKKEHQIFLEPEGLDSSLVYPSGISTSLPIDIQDEFIKTIPGLEQAKIIHYGYAVEYDVIEASLLKKTLEHKESKGLFFAGQINGTSGYEEAAVQGHVAGLNAIKYLFSEEPVIFSRFNSYIGVLVEDLVSSYRDEPYRLFTSRSEHRLSLREDNVYFRMAEYRKKYNLKEKIDQYLEDYIFSRKIFNSISLPKLSIKQDDNPIKVLEDFLKKEKILIDEYLVKDLAISVKYEGYLAKQEEDALRLKKLYEKKISLNFLLSHPGVSFECKQRIKNCQPVTFGDLRFIQGLRPSTLTAIASTL